MRQDAIFVYSEKQLNYKFNDDHPFNHLRLHLTYDLLRMAGALPLSSVSPPRVATDEEIGLIHDRNYINAVKAAGENKLDEAIAHSYGIGTEDTPTFPHMHEAAASLVGGTLTAVDMVMEGKSEHALNLGGGLHHGFRGKASGFCVYNDSSIAIEYMRRKYGVRVLYVDTDAHHGDGVQWSFYDEPSVCTFSIHETGRYLFPGTGSVHEKGAGKGYGLSINIPVDAFTEDDSFLECYETAFKELVEFYKPDVIFTQNGADAHYYDPLTHLAVSIQTYMKIPQIAHELAHKYCNGKWIAVGGGGYDMWRVVPRAWGLVWLAMTNQTHILKKPIPKAWIEKWEDVPDTDLPVDWTDPAVPPVPRRAEIQEKNLRTLEKALYHIRLEQG
ncbi:acetoin utilization protein AcuC [Bacillus piscicola]|uniref:acetoin utilization protein AcuC n=1 Tax=Bacillus piscicola TaxID=1632684 RepID=UPI001F096116|nr:acetoin utilization protein AcuC [Bacillus piscicola]